MIDQKEGLMFKNMIQNGTGQLYVTMSPFQVTQSGKGYISTLQCTVRYEYFFDINVSI